MPNVVDGDATAQPDNAYSLNEDGFFSSVKHWFLGTEVPTKAPAPRSKNSIKHAVNDQVIVVERREHAQAKRLKLSIRAGKVWLTVPPRTPETHIQKFLEASTPWLQSQLAKTSSQPVENTVLHGTRIDIPLLSTVWTVELVSDATRAFEVANVLYVPEHNSVQHIREHVRLQAKIYLPNRLTLLSQQCGLDYSGCTVRHATTRWGSCSAQKTISLNAALLLLPTPLIDYVLLHELCHIVEMNHSAAFWAKMSEVMPTWQQHRHALKRHQLPAWWTVLSD